MQLGIRWVFAPQHVCAVWACLIVHFDYRVLGSTSSIAASYWELLHRATDCVVRVCSILYMWPVNAGVHALPVKAFQESVRRTWHPCNLWRSEDFKLSVSSCMAKQQREVLPNYKGISLGVLQSITGRLPTLCFMLFFQWLLRAFVFDLIDLTKIHMAHRGAYRRLMLRSGPS